MAAPTLRRLQSVSPTSLVAAVPGPTAGGIRLPLTATLGGEDATEDCDPLLVIADDQLFDILPPTVTATDFACLVDFTNLSPMQVLAMLNGLADWLAQFRDSPVFGLKFPFVSGMTLGDLFDFSEAFVDAIYLHLVTPADSSVQHAVGVGGEPWSSGVRCLVDIQLGDLPAVRVVVPALDTLGNLSASRIWCLISTWRYPALGPGRVAGGLCGGRPTPRVPAGDRSA